MKRIASFIVSYPGLIIAVTLVITALFTLALVINGIKLNSAPETLTRHDEAFEFFKDTQKTFQDESVVIVALDASDIFTAEAKDRLDLLTTRFSALPGVSRAISLTNLTTVRREEGGIVVERLLPANASTELLQQRKASILSDPLYARNYISTDGRTAAISVLLEKMSVTEMRALAEEMERVVQAESRGDLWIAGLPLMDAKGSKSMTRDMLLLSPVAAIFCFLVFLATFRSFWGAMLPLLGLGMGLVWTVGFMGLLNKPITIATLTLPVVLLAVGSSYIFHVLNQYRLSMSALDADAGKAAQRAIWVDGLNFIIPAVFVSGTATIAGFASHASSPVPAVKDMGVFEALGVAFVLLLTIFFIPAALCLLPQHTLGRPSSGQKDYATWMNGTLKQITALILYRRRLVLTISILSTLFVGVGVYWMRVNTDYLKTFPRESDVQRTAARLHETLAGASVVQIVIKGETGAVTRPGFMQTLDSFEQFARLQDGVDAALSIADIVKLFNQAIPGKAEETSRTIPQDPARLQAIFENYLSQEESLNKLVSRDGSRAQIMLRTNLFGSNELRALTASLDNWAAQNLPANLTAQVTGAFLLLNNASDDIATSQASSLVIALLTIYVMMVLLFRSLMTGLLALLPNLLPIIGYFGFLGWAGITLDITTSIVASSVLGLAVDNAVHIIRRYRQSVAQRKQEAQRDAAGDEGWAMWLTMLRTGKPTTLANLMLSAAFLIFMLSSFNPVRTGGLLWALTIFACLVADLIFLPALMKTKWFAGAASGNSDVLEMHYQNTPAKNEIQTEKVGN